MAPPVYCEIDCGHLALEIASKPGWTRFASQGFSEAEAGLECHASVGESSVAVVWTAFGSDSHRITRGQTSKRNSRVGIGVSIHGLGLGEPYPPSGVSQHWWQQGLVFWCLVWRLERESMAAFGADSKISKLATRS
jgi:hypothetical protein